MGSARTMTNYVLLAAILLFPRLGIGDAGIDGLADQKDDHQRQSDLSTEPSLGITLSSPPNNISATTSTSSRVADPSLPQEGDDTGLEEGEEHQEGGEDETPRLDLPECYSSTEANPSLGAWTKCEGGERACSPAYQENWADANKIPPSYRGCRPRWESEHEGEGPMPYWTWEPSACTLKEVDVDQFCRVMAGRKGLLLVGDSVTGQMVETLAAVLQAEHLDRIKPVGSKWAACDGGFRFSWYRNDYVDTRTTEESGEYPTVHCAEPDVSDTRCVIFADDSVLGEYDTLVVNAGQHRSMGGIEEYAEMMKSTSTFLTSAMERLHGHDAILVVRNTVPGHGGSYERMFDPPVDIDTANAIVEEGPRAYKWYTIPDKNKLLEDAFLGTGGGWMLLDAYSPTVLRTDMHGTKDDGVHYCIPGPVDHWITLLYNILLLRTS